MHRTENSYTLSLDTRVLRAESNNSRRRLRRVEIKRGESRAQLTNPPLIYIAHSLTYIFHFSMSTSYNKRSRVQD